MKVAFYESDLTPPLGGFVWGHYNDVRCFEVQDRLFARAIVTEVAGEVSAIVCIDSCVLPAEMHDIVTARIFEYTGIPAERVCLCSNHTHWGMPIGDSPEINCYADSAYRDVCYRVVADTVTLAYRRLADATAVFGSSELYGYAFCRDYFLKRGVGVTFNGKNEEIDHMLSEIDPAVNVMLFKQGDVPVGALVNYSLHQCCGSELQRTQKAYTGDYASTLEKELKKIYGPDFVCVFLLAPCGDINHINTAHEKPYHTNVEIGKALAEKVQEAIRAATPVLADTLAVKKEALTIPTREAEKYATRERVAELAEMGDMMRARNLVYYHATNKDTEKTLWMQTVQLGDVAFYFFPGEIFVDFGKEIKARTTAKRVMVVENCNSYCGYVPTKRAFDSDCDLYETTLCHHSCLVPEAGGMMVEKLLSMLP